jgi:hypothetical protein
MTHQKIKPNRGGRALPKLDINEVIFNAVD